MKLFFKVILPPRNRHVGCVEVRSVSCSRRDAGPSLFIN